ncbi:MAG: HdeD family acid-resistance protein, partial [Ktedonobacteraceae bacterium]
VWPGITALVLLYLIAAWAIVTGILEIAAAFSRWLPIAHEWTLVLAGILSVLFGVLLAILPGVGLLCLVWLIGIYALAFGVVLIIRAFQFRTAGTAYT